MLRIGLQRIACTKLPDLKLNLQFRPIQHVTIRQCTWHVTSEAIKLVALIISHLHSLWCNMSRFPHPSVIFYVHGIIAFQNCQNISLTFLLTPCIPSLISRDQIQQIRTGCQFTGHLSEPAYNTTASCNMWSLRTVAISLNNDVFH